MDSVSTIVPAPPASSGRVESPFAVSFRHRLRYTDDVLEKDRDALIEVIEPSGEAPAKVQFFVDEHLAAARPDLESGLSGVLDGHGGRCVQAGDVRIVPGGEAIKNGRP